MKITRLFDLLPNYKEVNPNQPIALACKRQGKWIHYSIDDYIEQVNYVSAGLLSLGVKKDDKIAIISSNRPEYNILDMGIMQIGAVPVPIYPTISESDYQYILNHAEITYVFAEGEELLRKIEHILPEVPSLKGIYTFIDRGRHHYLSQLLEAGKANLDLEKIEAIKATVKEDDLACIIYTSGTTGVPKGVMLMHSNFVNQIMSVHHILNPRDTKALSFLPMCHAYEKMLLYVYQYAGMSIYYAENLGTIGENIKEVNPNIMCCVPRLLEKMYSKLFSAGKKLPAGKRQLYYWAFDLAMKYNLEGNSAWYNAQHKIADKLIYSQLRKAIGGDWDVIVSGSAAIQPQLVSFFTAIGMPIFEGYGLTETSPVIAVSNREPHGCCAGTVGFPIQGVEVKIVENNEIVCRGHNVMKGYYKAPDITAEAIDKDGWFHTGDTGIITEYGQLKITGRLKSIFKTSMGKYVNPFLLEEKMAQSNFIDSIMVVGENQKFCAALIAPDFTFLKNWAKLHDIEYTTNEEMVKHPRVRSRIGEEIKKYNAHFGDTEKIKKFELVPDEWTVKNGLLTPTLKIKRNKVAERYQAEIDSLFA